MEGREILIGKLPVSKRNLDMKLDIDLLSAFTLECNAK